MRLFLICIAAVTSFAQPLLRDSSTKTSRSPSATKPISVPGVKFVLWVNPEHWHEIERKSVPSGATVHLGDASGQAWATFMPDSTPGLKFSAERLFWKETPDVSEAETKKPVSKDGLISAATLIVNGREVSCLTFDSETNGRRMVSYGCNYFG